MFAQTVHARRVRSPAGDIKRQTVS